MPRLFITRRLRFTIAHPMSLMDLRHPYTGVTTTACATIIVTVAVAIEAPTSAERDSSPSASRSVGPPEQSNRGTWIETDLLGAREGPRVRIPVPQRGVWCEPDFLTQEATINSMAPRRDPIRFASGDPLAI
jgi:hypothetical protein